MTLRTLNTAVLGNYDGASESVLIDVVQTRMTYLLKRLEELPREIEAKKGEQANYREEVERLTTAFPGIEVQR